MATWPEISKEKAVQLLTEVGFENRIIGYESSATMGNAPFSLYSLREVHDFLRGKNGGGYIGYLDMGDLTTWVREVLGDRDLAEAIGKTVEVNDGYLKCAERVARLVEERFDQARAMAAV